MFQARYITVLTRVQLNILVDSTERARITGFGLATVTRDPGSVPNVPGGRDHTVRRTAPEILNKPGTYSKKADVFSFAMVMIEVRYGLPSVS